MITSLFLAKRHGQEAEYTIEETCVFPQYRDGGEGVHVYGTLPAWSVVYEGGDEVSCAVEEGDVVWV